MSVSPSSEATSTQSRRPGWGQFSLVSLLLLVVIGCLVGAYFGEQRQRKETEERLRAKEAENRQYRIDLGILDDRPSLLVVTDPKSVYVRTLPAHDEMHWRFRVYLPPGTRWRLRIGQGETWNEVDTKYGNGGAFTELKESGELTFDTKVVRTLDGKPQLEVFWGNRGFGTAVPDAALTILRSQVKRTIHVTGSKAQETFDAQGRIQLLRWHVDLPDSSLSDAAQTLPGRRQPGSSYGFCIYLEEILPGQR